MRRGAAPVCTEKTNILRSKGCRENRRPFFALFDATTTRDNCSSKPLSRIKLPSVGLRTNPPVVWRIYEADSRDGRQSDVACDAETRSDRNSARRRRAGEAQNGCRARATTRALG